MNSHLWKKHPFRLLLYLEWILFGIALMAVFSALFPERPPPRAFLRPDVAAYFPLSRNRFLPEALLSLAALGLMGLRLPLGSRWLQAGYITLGFVLSWLVILLGGRAERVFPPLLLIVAIRACVLFPWSGRIVVALFAYASFLGALAMSWLRIRPLGVPLGRALPPGVRRLPSDELQRILLSLNLNSALLFGLVLAFVLLLVGAVLAEHRSREQLTAAHRRLRQYALRIENQATLEERNRIAREIHDSVGHYLTAQSIQLENVALFLAQNPERAGSHLQKARKLGKEALENVRHSVAALRNDPLQGRSLVVALERLVEEFQKTTGLAWESRIELPSSLSAEITTALYRVIQEALTNITKHSQATRGNLSLQQQGNRICLQLADNGCGFEPTENTTGFGLQGMRERIEALGGRFETVAAPGKGCRIEIEIPIEAALAPSRS